PTTDPIAAAATGSAVRGAVRSSAGKPGRSPEGPAPRSASGGGGRGRRFSPRRILRARLAVAPVALPRVFSCSILMVINGALPFRLTGTIRKSTRRIKSTKEISLPQYGVEWRAETGNGEKAVSIRYNLFDSCCAAFGKETCDECENNDS